MVDLSDDAGSGIVGVDHDAALKSPDGASGEGAGHPLLLVGEHLGVDDQANVLGKGKNRNDLLSSVRKT